MHIVLQIAYDRHIIGNSTRHIVLQITYDMHIIGNSTRHIVLQIGHAGLSLRHKDMTHISDAHNSIVYIGNSFSLLPREVTSGYGFSLLIGAFKK